MKSMTQRKLAECLNGQYQKKIAPFFWQHGDAKEELEKMIDVIASAHIDAFCVESRTHEQFCEEKWWDDFHFILEEAKKRDMKVWLFDDKHFPSGRANGYLEAHPELARRAMREEYIDVAGPQKQAGILTDRCKEGEVLLYVLAYRRDEDGVIMPDTCINLTKQVCDGMMIWDIPAGFWRVFFLILEKGDTGYIDMLSWDSSHAMLDAVYEPHYAHFSQYFGNTFVGFFADEPRFGNEYGTYETQLGREEISVPFCREIVVEIAEEIGRTEEEVLALLPGVWHDMTLDTDVVRNGYMEVITKRYRKNFSVQIGDWCRAHGVMYIGHVIEDKNANMRIGFGSGHIFRALEGQDMSGVDVVLHQIMPGLNEMVHRATFRDHGAADPDFFDYTLAKLAVSVAHLDPKKKNRCMCEIFGAYGWTEGLPLMKYLADHMLVNGCNFFVPHAFTNRYPLQDCPPHFWADGTNPQFRYFGDLMDYMNRCIHMLSDGTHQADVAVYYNAEGEWCGGAYMLFQKVAKTLTRNQIDFDFVPQDSLRKAATVKDGRLFIGEESYGALVVSYSELLPQSLLDVFEHLAEQGLLVVFTDGLPKNLIEREGMPTERCLPEDMAAVPLCEIPNWIKNRGMQSISAEQPYKNLRFYHVRRGGEDVVMFFNDSPWETIDTEMQLPFSGELTWYDAWTGKCWCTESADGQVRLQLSEYSTLFVMTGAGLCRDDFGDANVSKSCEKHCDNQIHFTPELLYDIYVQEAGKEEYCYARQSTLFNFSLPEHLPHFCGTIRYKTSFVIDYPSAFRELDLGTVGETAEVYLNDRYCGLRIQPPYQFDIRGALQDGVNELEIIVANNPVYRERDMFSRMMAAQPSGLLGEVRLLFDAEYS